MSVRCRLKSFQNGNHDKDMISPSTVGDLEAALRLSGGKGKVAARAFCQRGMINRKVK